MKTTSFPIAPFALVFFLLMAAPTMAGAASLSPADLAGTYRLARVNGQTYTAERPAELRVGPGQALAGRICNTFRGQYSLDNDVIAMPDFMLTRMACPGELGTVENLFLQGLRSGYAVMVYGDTLELRRDDRIYIFTKTASDASAGEDSSDTASGRPGTAAGSTGSTATSGTGTVNAADLVGRTFILARVDGKPFQSEMGRQPSISFASDMRVSGSACNQFSGPGELEDGVLTVANAASTMMLCVDQALSAFERDFHQMLRDGATVSLDGDTLTLSRDSRRFEYTLE
ncbi:MAG: META domain-containing protein [Planctomycetaceae bacterium]|nr:META domain-containing protein [Planctomycetaceae bacterium]